MKKIINKKVLLIVSILFFLGFLTGIFFIFFTNDMDKSLVKGEIIEYINFIDTNQYSNIDGLLNSIKINLLYLTIISVSGIIFIFVPVILFINFYKGFLIGFMFSSFILTYKFSGILYGFLFIFPHEIINILTFGIYSILVLNYSYKIMKSIYKNESINTRFFIKKYSMLYLVFLFILIISSLLEVYLNGFLIRIIF